MSRTAVHNGDIWYTSFKKAMLLTCNMEIIVVNVRRNISFIGVMCGYLSTNVGTRPDHLLSHILLPCSSSMPSFDST